MRPRRDTPDASLTARTTSLPMPYQGEQATSHRPGLRRSLVTRTVVPPLVGVLALLTAGPAVAATDTTPPSTPSSVAGVFYGGPGTGTGVALHWGSVSASDLAAYRVYRSATKTVPTGTGAIPLGTVTTANYTDSSAQRGVTSYYAVTAVDRAGNESKASTVVGVTTVDTTAPDKPGSLKLTPSGTGIALDWADVPQTPDFAGYRVSRSTSSSGTYTPVTTASISSSLFTDTGAPSGTTSYYRVSSLDQSGNASSPATAYAVRPAAGGTSTVPTPASLTATATSSGAALKWTANPSGTTASYRISYSPGPDGPWTQLATGLTGTTYTDTKAPAAATAYYSVVAVNNAGAVSAARTASVVMPRDTTPPATPGSATAKIVNGVATLTWKANTESDLAGYRLLKRNGDGVYVDWPSSDPSKDLITSTTATDPSVTEGKTAYFRIRAIDRAGNLSSYASATAVNPMVAPVAPAGLTATAGAGTPGVRLSWTADTEADLAGYNVFRSTYGNGPWSLLGTVAGIDGARPASSFADVSAPKGVKQYYYVSAADLVGNVSKASTTVSGTSVTDPVALPVNPKILTVSADGVNGAFRTVTAALASIPAGNLRATEIDIAPGTYHESFAVAGSNITLRGTSGNPADVVVVDDKAAGQLDGSTDDDTGLPGTYGTAGSATVFVSGKNVTFRDLTVSNSFDEAAHPEITSQQAVALRVEGDRFVAQGVRLLGNQDTLLADTPKPTTRIRQYYYNSYIEGDVDYIFGAATAVFDHCTLRSLNRGKSNNGYVTAASTDKGSKYGFLVTNSHIVSDAADGTVYLGRPWHPDADVNALASVVFKGDDLSGAIRSTPWSDMTTSGVAFSWKGARFSEYRNTGDGALAAGTTSPDRPQLTDKDATNATPAKYLAGSDGWSPVPAAEQTAPDAPSALSATGGYEQIALAWTGNGEPDVAGYRVYRSATGSVVPGSTTLVSGPELLLNPGYTDLAVLDATTYSYVVTAVDWDGNESATSAVAAAQTDRTRADLTVAKDGSGDFTTIGAALASIPAARATRTVVLVKPGVYEEYLTVAKSDIVLIGAGASASDVVITGNRAAGTPTGGLNPDGSPATYGTSGSATVLVTGNRVEMRDLTIANSYKEGTYANGQAVALRTVGDRLVFDGVRLLGNQDTLYANSPTTATQSRAYFHDCYVEGDVDFLFGRATAVFDSCTLKALDHGTSPNGAVTAASTDASNPYGFLITGSRIIGSAPDGSENLGRPWQPGITQPDGTSVKDDHALGQVVVRDSWLGPVVSTTATWTNMVNSGVTTDWHTARFAEYADSGPGAGTGAGRPQLSAADAAGYTAQTYLAGADAWNPVQPAAADVAPAAVTALAGSGDSKLATLTWDESTEADVTGYRIYRAAGTTVPVDADHLLTTVASAHYTDKAVTNGTSYAYAVVAVDAAGHTSAAAGPVTVTPGPKPLVADLVVAADGSGQFTSLQAALTAAPAGTATRPTVIFVRPGTYREVVNSAKPYLTIVGTTGNPRDVVVTFDNANGTPSGPTTCPSVTAATCGTGGSATVSLTGANVTVSDLTIANGFVAAGHPEIGNYNTQAVALNATGDRQVYDGVRLLGVQDTLLADGAGTISGDGSGYPRQYFHDSYITGNVDFIFGRATAVFDHVTIAASSHSGGTVFAPSTASKAKGYLVLDSRIVSDNDPGTFALGRPWRAWSDGAYPDNSRGQTWLVDTWIGEGIDAAHPWVDFSPNAWSDGRWAEYATSGPGAGTNSNRPSLSAAQAATATPQAWLAGNDGWDPVADPAPDLAPAPPVGLRAGAADASAGLSWDESSEADVVGYHVYRATGATGVPIDAAHRVERATLTRAGFTDTGLANGTTYSYAVTALDAAGHESAATTPVTVAPALHIDATVGPSGDYATLQAAVNALGDGTRRVVISVAPGTYAGTSTIAKNNVLVVGATGDPADVVLTNASTTPTLSVSGSNVTIQDVTLANTTTGQAAPAVAMTGDRVLLEHDVLKGANRTVFADTATYTAAARQMIDSSVIEGSSDVVLGRATLVVNASTVNLTAGGGAVLTPSTATTFKGMLVVNSTVNTPDGVSGVQLGRPYRAWGDTYLPNSRGQAVVRETALGAGIRSSQPWGTGPAGETWTLGRFAEFANTGAGAGVNDNRPQLSPAESVSTTVTDWIGASTWYPAVAAPATPADVTAPGAVTGLVATPGDGKLGLRWTGSTEDDLAGYRVYRSTSSPVALSVANRVGGLLSTPEFTDTGLTNGTRYSYAVVALDAAGNVSTPGTLTAAPADSVAPGVPGGVKAGVGDSRITVTWTAGTDSDLAGYNVYRGTTRLNPALLTTPSFAESGLVNGQSYDYAVTAVDTAGNESAASAVVTATPVPGDSTPPAVPAGVTTVLGKGSVSVSWAAPGDGDLAGYTVWRSSGGTDAVRLGSGLVTATSFTDTSVVNGTTYAYTVSASDTAGNESALSPAAPATPVKVDLVVAADGSGDATTVAGGIALLADNADYGAQGGRTILVKPGTYTGVVTSGNRYGVTLLGATTTASDTVLSAGGTGVAATLTLTGNAWTVRNLTVANTNGAAAPGASATALQVKAGDKDVFDNVRFLGDKQTLLLSTANATTFSREYFRRVFVEGGADLVLGRATAVFDRSTFHVLNRPGASLTDSSVASSYAYGFLITDSTITTDGNPGSIYLGRPYSTQGSAQVVVRNTALGAAINTAQPWNNWDSVTQWTAGRFSEYQNSGPGAAITNPATRPQLSDADAGGFTAQKYLAGADGWNPVG